MRVLHKAWNTWQGEDSNPITTAETTCKNSLPTQANAYNFTYHAKQLGKGLLVFGAGLLGYVGFSVFFGSRREVSTLETEGVVDGNLDLPMENLLNVQAKIRGIPTALDHQAPKGFVPTSSLSTARTLLSLREKKAGQSSVERKVRVKDSVEADKEIPSLASTRRAALEIGYRGGMEFRVNTYTTSIQEYPVVTALTGGGFVVVWSSYVGNYNVYGQRYNATGYPLELEFQVNTYTTLAQEHPAVTAFPTGGFVVVWSSYFQDASDGYGVYGQCYNPVGQALGPEFQVNNYTSSHQYYPAVTSFPAGGFVVVWSSDGQDGDGYGIYGQRYNATGQTVGAEFQVNTYTTSWQRDPAVTALTEGGFVVVWHSPQDGSGYGVYGQRYNATGQPEGAEFRVNTYTTGSQASPAVTAFPTGGFVVVWSSAGQDGSSDGIYGQRYNTTGLPEGTEFQVNTYTTSIQRYPAVTALPTGGFVVLWESNGQDGSDYGIYGQRYNAAGLPEGIEFQVNKYTVSDQERPSVSPLNNGSFIVVWSGVGNEDIDGIYARISGVSIINNQLAITEGLTASVSLSLLSASSMEDQDNDIVFTMNNVQHGWFEKSGVEITSFTQQDIMDNLIQFVHDGTEIAPSYSVKANDGRQETPYQTAQITFNPTNDLPQIVNNKLEINQGKSRIITSDILSATDEETADTALVFTVRNATHCWFNKIDKPSVVIVTFSQQDIMDNNIRFVHDGSVIPPFYGVKVSDGVMESPYDTASITFYLKNSTNVINPVNVWLLPVIITSSLLGAACLFITVGGAFVITAGGIYIAKSKKYRKSMHDIELETLEGTVTLSPFMHEFNIDSREIKLIEKIGQGGQASVYRAKWSNKTVAYKVTRIIDVSAISEFEKEAEIMLKSNHPNIVHVFRICVTPKRIGLVMEFMAFGSLKAAIQKKSITLTWETKWNIAYDLATVVAFLHEQDIVHRDIKTDNLLLYQEDGEIHAKLADFGLSKGKQKGDASVTMGIGTYKYMAPEMVLGDGRYSEKATDVYAIGMTFVALVNQEEPYSKITNAMSIPAAVGNRQYWQKLTKKYDPAFFKLTNLCRSIDPEERPTAKDIVKQLKEIEEPIVDFEENEELNQEHFSTSFLMDKPTSKELPIKATVAATQVVPQAVKHKPLDEFVHITDILNNQKQKVEDGEFEALSQKF